MPTLTVYPDPSTGGTTVDGWVRRTSTGESFATMRGGAGVDAGPSQASNVFSDIIAHTVADEYIEMVRTIYTFDTSPLGTGATITAAVLSFFGLGTGVNTLGGGTYNVFGATPAANNDLVAADYSQLGTTAFATAIAFASWSESAYNDFTLNASGISNINKTGISRFGGREDAHDAQNSAPTWGSSNANYVFTYYADQAGTANDPKLVITYTTGRPLGLLLMGVGT